MKLFNWVNKKLKPGINPAPAPVATYDLGRLQAKDGSSIGKKQQLGWQREELHRSRRELQSLFGQEELAPKPGIGRYPCGNASSLLAIGTLGAMQEEEAEEGAGFNYLSGGGGDGSGGGGGSGGAIMTESELLELQEALQRALLAAAANVQAEKLPAAASAVAAEKVPASSGGEAVDGGEAAKKANKKAAAKTKKEASAAANLAKKVGMATLTDNKNNSNSNSSSSNSNSNIPANNLFKKQSLLHRFSKACSKKVNPPTSQAKLSTSDSDMKYWRSDHQPSKSILNWKNVHPPSTLRSKKPPPPTTIGNATSASVSASAHRSKLAKFLQAFRKGKKSQVCPAPSSSSMLQQHISSGAQAGAGYGHARLSAFERRGADYPVSDYALDVLGSQMRLQLRNGREDYSNEEEEEEEEDRSAMADDMGAFCDEYAYRLRHHHHYNEEDEEEEEDMEMEMDDLDYTIQWLIKNDQEYWIKTDDEYVVLEL